MTAAKYHMLLKKNQIMWNLPQGIFTASDAQRKRDGKIRPGILFVSFSRPGAQVTQATSCT